VAFLKVYGQRLPQVRQPGLALAIEAANVQAGAAGLGASLPCGSGRGSPPSAQRRGSRWDLVDAQVVPANRAGRLTRARDFYARRAWRLVGRAENGALRLELQRPA
jgi:hypothetical protein